MCCHLGDFPESFLQKAGFPRPSSNAARRGGLAITPGSDHDDSSLGEDDAKLSFDDSPTHSDDEGKSEEEDKIEESEVHIKGKQFDVSKEENQQDSNLEDHVIAAA